MSNKSEAHTFYYEHVATAIEDWRKNETAIHKAMLVATNLNHLADYYWRCYSDQPSKVFGKNNLRSFRDHLIDQCPDYGLIRDVCDAHKHLTLDRSSRRVTNADQTTKGRMGWGEAKFGDARWGSPEEIVVTDDDGEKHHFIGMVNRTEGMWQKLLQLG